MTGHLGVWAVAAALIMLLFAPMLDPLATLVLAAGLLGSLIAIEWWEGAHRGSTGQQH